MSPGLILICIATYFFILLAIAWYTGRNTGSEGYFLGNKASPWIAVAFGMIGDSLSGVTFISVPGAVGLSQFSYMQLVFGYFFGYIVITQVLLPLYYRMNLTSIYSYLGERMGSYAEKTGAFYFILSRTLGAAARLYLAALVLQVFVFDHFHVPFGISVSLIIFLMLAYTFRGGIKTLVWTDAFQSTFLLLGVILSIFAIGNSLDLSVFQMAGKIADSDLSTTFFWDWREKNFFFKQFFGGMFIAIAMTGLDQNMMQKNLSCRSLPDAQKNIRWFSLVLVIVNVFFLSLGVLLYLFVSEKGIQVPLNADGKVITDKLFPVLALEHLGIFAGLAFIVGLTAATFSSADSVLTTLTTSFYYDFLGLHKRTDKSEKEKAGLRTAIHIMFAVILLMVILLFRILNNQAIIDTVLWLAGYTYGPLLGLFAFGILTRHGINDKWVPVVALVSPGLTFLLEKFSPVLLNGYKFGNEILLLNGLITFSLLYMVSRFFSPPGPEKT